MAIAARPGEDLAAHRLDQTPADGQSKTGALLACRRRGRPEELVENHLEISFRHTGPIVDDLQDDLAADGPPQDFDAAAVRYEPDGVLNDIGQGLLRQDRIAERGEIIGAIYDGADAIPVDTTIAFQDGTKQRIRTVLQVMRMEAAGQKAPALAEGG